MCIRDSIKPTRKFACISRARNPFGHHRSRQYNVCDDLGFSEVSVSLGLCGRNLIHPHSGMVGLYCLLGSNGARFDLELTSQSLYCGHSKRSINHKDACE